MAAKPASNKIMIFVLHGLSGQETKHYCDLYFPTKCVFMSGKLLPLKIKNFQKIAFQHGAVTEVTPPWEQRATLLAAQLQGLHFR